jgi:hypothetical protein
LKSCFTIVELKVWGFNVTDFKNGYYTAAELKAAEYSLIELKSNYTATELKIAITATEHRASGCTLSELRAVGYNRSALVDAGFDEIEILHARTLDTTGSDWYGKNNQSYIPYGVCFGPDGLTLAIALCKYCDQMEHTSGLYFFFVNEKLQQIFIELTLSWKGV